MPVFYGKDIPSRLMLGTAQYPSPAILAEAFRQSGAGIATVSVRREAGGEQAGQDFWGLIQDLGVAVLPNTAGCHSVREAVTTAQMARELFDTNWIKLEVIGHADTLQPDPFGLVEAAAVLSEDGFEVFPYCTEDLVLVRPAGRGRVQGADALGRADWHRAGAQQHLWASVLARAFSRTFRWWWTRALACQVRPLMQLNWAMTPCC